MWFEDLSPCTYFPIDAKVIAIGWLERDHPYATGTVERAVYERLAQFRVKPWQPVVFMGVHACTLCQFAPEAHSAANLFVPGEDAIFVCPELITHSINAHHYAPPEPFRRAVLACPPMGSMPYLEAIAKRGGSRLIRSTTDR